MLNALIRFSLRYRMLIVVLSMTLMIYGSYLATTLPIDVFPDLDRPRVVILTECPGLATEEVETLVTQPIEIAILGASGVQAVRSQSTAGLNVVYVEFDWTTDVRTARQTVQERLATLAGVLPENIRPQMTPTASIMGQIVIGGMYRQLGPKGGQLVPIRDADLMAEVVDSDESEATDFTCGSPRIAANLRRGKVCPWKRWNGARTTTDILTARRSSMSPASRTS